MSETISPWVIPAGIPFDSLKGYDLEECIYWLMDSLGAKDLEWRVGGANGGASDGGRDLEATFFSPAPDGEMEAQRWWVECKGRSGTVEPEAVKSACLNASSQADLAYLVIATNTTFSNPTRDWVKEWNTKHPQPKVKLWDRSTLERMLSKHPSAVFRLFSGALSTAGRLEVAREGFWNRFDYASPQTLKSFWAERDSLPIGALERIALTISEFSHGRIGDRPWGVACTAEQAVETVGLAFANLPYLYARATKIGAEQRPLIRGLAYLLLSALKYVPAASIAELIDLQLTPEDGEAMPDGFRTTLVGPIIDSLVGEMQEVCTADCPRFLLGRGKGPDFDNDPTSGYWARLNPRGAILDDSESEGEPTLWIQKMSEPCKVGFLTDEKRGCPLFEDDVEDADLVGTLAIIERVADYRAAETPRSDQTPR